MTLVTELVPAAYDEVFIVEEPQPAPRVQIKISCMESADDPASKMTAPIAESLKESCGKSTQLSRFAPGEPGVASS